MTSALPDGPDPVSALVAFGIAVATPWSLGEPGLLATVAAIAWLLVRLFGWQELGTAFGVLFGLMHAGVAAAMLAYLIAALAHALYAPVVVPVALIVPAVLLPRLAQHLEQRALALEGLRQRVAIGVLFGAGLGVAIVYLVSAVGALTMLVVGLQ